MQGKQLTKTEARAVGALRRQLASVIAAEERADTLECAWKLAAKADRLSRAIRCAELGIVIPAPRTARNRAKGALKALATIGTCIARAMVRAAALKRAQAAAAIARAARKAAEVARAAMRRTVAAVGVLAFLSTSVPAADAAVTLTIERQDMKNEMLITGPRKGPRSAAAKRVVTQKVTVLFRSYNRVPERMRVKSIAFEAPVGLSIEELIAMAHAMGASPGARSPAGVFEIQTDEGIWSTGDETKLLTTSNSGLSKKAQFKSWEVLESEEAAS